MQETIEQFTRIFTRLLEDEKENPVAEYIPAADLDERLDIALQDEGISEEALEKALIELVLTTPRTATHSFFNQLFGGRNQKAVLGDLLAVVLNNSMYTYKAAGPQIGVEKEILRKVCEMLDWSEEAGGTLAAGGSMTNFMALLMARDAVVRRKDYKGGMAKLRIYTSAESHYSVPKNAAFSGVGRDNVRYVPTDKQGRMDLVALEEIMEADKKEGAIPMLLNATAGTTVMGAFDPILPLSEVCRKNNMWLHVDGAYCGSVLFSKRYRHLIEGIEKVDSFSFNAHKMLGTPLSCSIIVAREKSNLYESFSNEASYLYQTDHDEFNLGKTSLQCGRRNDALKFWTLWKSVGTRGLEQIVDHQFYLADVAREYVREHPDYQLYSFDDSISICFNYKQIPAEQICTQLFQHSELLVGYGRFAEDEFIRLVTINAQNSKEDILRFFQLLEQFVADHAHLFTLKSEVQ